MEPPYGALLRAAGFVDFHRLNPNSVLREFFLEPGRRQIRHQNTKKISSGIP